MPYADFLQSKAQAGAMDGFDPIDIPSVTFDFQQSLTEWAIRKGRAAIFADCGLGKTLMELVWADNVARHTGRPVLVLTPLAVGAQMVREAQKFGIDCARSQDGSHPCPITVTNYQRLGNFRADDFAGVVCDESSILKSFDGSTKQEVTDFMRKVPYRLLATATAAPNDFIELGTSSEALGYLGHMDMLAKFFKNDANNCATRRMYGEAPKWRLKGHAETPFWRWVTSWARACRKPSDLGFDDGDLILPPMSEVSHIIDTRPPDGMLFNAAGRDLREQRAETKRTVAERCDAVAALVGKREGQSLVWCHLNEEGKRLREIIPESVEVSGANSDDVKEQRLESFAMGQTKVLITKPKIGAWGLNFQSCNHVTYFPSHSFEQYYQAVRRCWRFGQKMPVTVDIVSTEGESRVHANLQRKSEQSAVMFSNLVAEMNRATAVDRPNPFTKTQEIPSWL